MRSTAVTKYSYCTEILNFVDVTVSVPAMLSIMEGDSFVEVCVTQTAIVDTERAVTVVLSTSDGTG